MSIDYRPLADIAAADLFDGRLEGFGVREHSTENTTDECRMLTDGRNYLWVYTNDGSVQSFSHYLPNGAPGKILNAVSEAFDVDIVSEHEPQYWGFDTHEEWDTFLDKMAEEAADEFYADIV